MDKDKKNKDDRDPESNKHHHHSSGGIPFGLEVILFVVVIFIIWVLTGGIKKEQPEGSLFNPIPADVNPATPTKGYN